MRNESAIFLHLAVHEGENPMRRTTVVGTKIKIGRHERSDIRIDDPAIGGMHAIVEMDAHGQLMLLDLGNGQPTRLNGQTVTKARLGDGDEIGLGRTRIVIEHIAQAVETRIANALPMPPRFDFGERDSFREKPLAAEAREGSYEYRLMQRGEVSPSETDSPASGVALVVRWGTNVLSVAHLTMDAGYWLGSDDDLPSDFSLPAETMGGRARAPIALAGAAVLWPGMRGTVTDPGGASQPIEAVIAAGRTQPCAELSGGELLPLSEGMSVTLRLGELVFELSGEKRGRKLAGWSLAALAGGAAGYVAASFVAHTGLLGALAFLAPPLTAASDDTMSDEQRYFITQVLDSLQERERDQLEQRSASTAEPGSARGGERAANEESKMGSHGAPVRDAKFQIMDRGTPPQLASREALLADAAEMGMAGMLSTLSGSLGAPTQSWGGLDSSGYDPLDARGNIWGGEAGPAWGPGGLGLTGVGEGGGGKGRGIGLTNIGTFGGGLCDGCDGFGRSHGRLGKRHVAGAPVMRTSHPVVSGRIPPEVIQRIVRMNHGRFRACYESGLRNNPNLAGNVTVSFIINRDGQITSVGGGGSLPDGGVVSCITQAFYGLTFPQPEGGIVTVSYSLSLTPGG